MFESGQRHHSFRAVWVLAAFALVAVSCSASQGNGSEPSPVAPSEAPAATDGAEDQAVTPDPADPSTSAVPDELPGADIEAVAGDLPGLVVRRAGNGDIVTSAPDGSNDVAWASGSEFASMQPTWAPSGRTLAWSMSNADSSVVARVDVDNPTASPVTTDISSPPFYLSWSPDGSWISGLRNGPTGLEFVTIETATNAATSAFLGQPFFFDWVDDDTVVAAVSGLVLTDVAAADFTPRQRPLDVPLGFFQTPVALDDRAVLAATRGQTGNNDIVRVDADFTSTLLARADSVVSFSLSPDGQQVAVLVGPGVGEEEPEFISFEPGQQTQQTTDDFPQLATGRVSVLDLDSGEVVTRPETGLIAVNWSPTGENLALLQIEDNQLRWIFADPTSATNEPILSSPFTPSAELARSYLPFIDQYDRSSTWWSPDGRGFVFSGSTLDRSGIWVDRIDDDAGPAFLGEGDIAFWSPE